MRLPIWLIIMILVFAGIIWLQIFLSKKENKFLGLILPLVIVCISISAIFITPVYVTSPARTVVEHGVTQFGDVVQNIITYVPKQSLPGIASMIFTGINIFILYNIPTAILLIIYAACRVKRKKNMELEKMNIQDLS